MPEIDGVGVISKVGLKGKSSIVSRISSNENLKKIHFTIKE